MSEADDNHILSHCDGGVQILHIHRPEKKNALTGDMYRALANGIRMADNDPAVRVILLRGEEDCFTSGNDVNDFVGSDDRSGERPSVLFMKAIAHARKPLVAAVNGLAVGIGTTLLMHCDLVYAADDAWLQLPFTRLGLCPEAGSSYLAPLLMGHQRAAELLLLGERFSADKARDCGLVNEVLPTPEATLTAAMQAAKEIASKPPVAIWGTKQVLHYARDHSTEDSLRHMGWLQGAIWSNANVREAISAMQEKREANFAALSPLKGFREFG